MLHHPHPQPLPDWADPRNHRPLTEEGCYAVLTKSQYRAWLGWGWAGWIVAAVMLAWRLM